jgi:hypothetical protein
MNYTPTGAQLYGKPVASILMHSRLVHVRALRWYAEVYIEYGGADGEPVKSRFAFKADATQVRELLGGLTRALAMIDPPSPVPTTASAEATPALRPHVIRAAPLSWRALGSLAGNGAPSGGAST